MIEVNYLSVIIAGVVSMGVGFFWYSPVLFAKPWMKLMGYTNESMKKAQKEMGKTYFLSFLATLLTAYVLSHTMALSENFYGYPKVITGLSTAFWMWVGFVMPVQLTDVFFGNKQWKLFGINTGYQLASMLVMGVVIGFL